MGARARGLGPQILTRHGVCQRWQLTQDALKHLLLVLPDRRGELDGLIVADAAGEMLDRGVRRDLERFGRTNGLGVLEDLLSTTGTPQQIERGLGQRQALTEELFPDAYDDPQGIGSLAELLQALADTGGVLTRLLQVGLKR